MAKRAAAVKDAHAHLCKTVPGFSKQPGPVRLQQVHAHIKKTGAC